MADGENTGLIDDSQSQLRQCPHSPETLVSLQGNAEGILILTGGAQRIIVGFSQTQRQR